jgi:hypothetical protein
MTTEFVRGAKVSKCSAETVSVVIGFENGHYPFGMTEHLAGCRL